MCPAAEQLQPRRPGPRTTGFITIEFFLMKMPSGSPVPNVACVPCSACWPTPSRPAWCMHTVFATRTKHPPGSDERARGFATIQSCPGLPLRRRWSVLHSSSLGKVDGTPRLRPSTGLARHHAASSRAASQPGGEPTRASPREENAHRQPGQETVRPQEGLGLFPLMLLDSDDLRHPLRHNLPGGDVDIGRGTSRSWAE